MNLFVHSVWGSMMKAFGGRVTEMEKYRLALETSKCWKPGHRLIRIWSSGIL